LVFRGFPVTAGHFAPYVTALTCNFSLQKPLRPENYRLTAGGSAD
jgi:hypothetical protein